MSDSEDSGDWYDKDIDDIKIPEKKVEKIKIQEDEEVDGASGSTLAIKGPGGPPEDYGGSYNIPKSSQKSSNSGKKTDKSKGQNTKKARDKVILKMLGKELLNLAEMNPLDTFIEVTINFERFKLNAFDEEKTSETIILLIRILSNIHQVPLNYHVELLMNEIIKPGDTLSKDILQYVRYAADLKETNKPNLLLNADRVFSDLKTICKYAIKYTGDYNNWASLAKGIFEVLKEKTENSLVEACFYFGKIGEDVLNNTFPESIYGTLKEVNEVQAATVPKLKKGKFNSSQEYLEYHTKNLKSCITIPLYETIKELRLRTFLGNNEEPFEEESFLEKFGNTNVFPCVRIYKSFPQLMTFTDKYFLLDLVPHKRDNRKLPQNITKKITASGLNLNPGSLIYLSTSFKFENFIVAEIPYLPDEIQQAGFLIIDIHHMENIQSNIFNTHFVLVTIPIVFQPIFDPLKVLKKFSPETLPMKEYFVKCENLPILPDYENLDEYTLSTEKINLRSGKYDKTDLQCLGMNEKQFQALQLALTRRLCLIQGPPGTGKTTVALNIVQRLLTNTSFRILIVTYRNFALDKFLLACSTLTNKIVRLGQQFADPEVKKFVPVKSTGDPRLSKLYGKTLSEYTEAMEKFVDHMKNFEDKRNEIADNFRDLRQTTLRLNQLSTLSTYYSCLDARIIGMTTTGAAKNHDLLELLKPEIVIMEEAAEVPEAHAIATLTEYTQQLILIGDHKQLSRQERSCGDHALFFRRLITHGVNNVCLNFQYRMHPDISDLVRYTIYEDLNDGENVKQYKPIRGILKNLFCVSHENLETLAKERYELLKQEFPDEEEQKSTSKENFYEMLFAVGLAVYLRQQGYQSHEIVILTTYSGQQAATLSILIKFPLLKGVEVHTVDSYQGQECKIVILSLVRSNILKNIGFLTNEQRLCVLLTRAQEGLYILGNLDLLATKNSAWNIVRSKLLAKGAIGPALPIKCEKHDCEMMVSGMEDFLKFEKDGCPIGENLSINHKHLCLDDL